jgi:Cu(I)/Ag(I) efflux system periplasmic protein CusF
LLIGCSLTVFENLLENIMNRNLMKKPMKWAFPAIALFSASLAFAQLTPAEVRKVDKETGRVTLRHAEVKKHDMPAMTMVFRVKEPAMIDQLIEGSKVLIDMERIGGYWTITEVKPAPAAGADTATPDAKK